MKVPYSMHGRPIVLDFKTKFNKFEFLSCLESAIGKQLPNVQDIDSDNSEAHAFLLHLCMEAKIQVLNTASCGKLLDKLFGHFVEPELSQPTFIIDFPQCLSPLAKPHGTKPYISERFELYVAGNELVNAYTELNNPMLQREMFAKQTEKVDEDYIRALEYGLPPTAGFGIGIDRLVMILTNQTSIKEVLTFPMLRPVE